MPPAARMNDPVMGTDIHIVLIPSPGGPVPTPMPMPFSGQLLQSVSTNVLINGMGAATVGSVAMNLPPHVPAGGPFQKPPTNQGTVMMGSVTVLINGQGAARLGDTVQTCNDPVDAPVGQIAGGSPNVVIG
ncbi:PAAR domain-containing protein [Acidothermaceae bacterium B102]|nr:PAAR domain-containing protein [Acidothermaceae bacterium B102]